MEERNEKKKKHKLGGREEFMKEKNNEKRTDGGSERVYDENIEKKECRDRRKITDGEKNGMKKQKWRNSKQLWRKKKTIKHRWTE